MFDFIALRNELLDNEINIAIDQFELVDMLDRLIDIMALRLIDDPAIFTKTYMYVVGIGLYDLPDDLLPYTPAH